MLLVCHPHPQPPTHAGWALPQGQEATLPQGLGPAQQPLRAGNFLHLRNTKGPSSFSASSTAPPPPSPPLSQALHGLFGGQPTPLLSVSPQPTPSTVAIVCLP